MNARAPHPNPNAAGRARRTRSSEAASPKALGVMLLTALLAIGMLVPPDALAGKHYSSARKFRRGVSNMALGVLAIPGQMTEQTRKRGPAVGLPYGFVKGIGYFVGTELVGVWEFLTCPFQFPRNYRPILEPEYPWAYFEGPPRRRPTRAAQNPSYR